MWRPLKAFCAIAVLAQAVSVQAQLLSYESFGVYPAGTQVPATTPSPAQPGYTGNWTGVDFGSSWPTVLSGPLTYGGSGYANGSGNHINKPAAGGINAGNSGRMYRLLDSTTQVTSSTPGVIYLSWLYKNGREVTGTVFQMLDLYNGSTADSARTFTAGLTQNGGNSGNQYDFGVNETYHNFGVTADTNTHLFVVKIDTTGGAGASTVTVWLDPTLGANDPAGGVVITGQTIAFDRLTISDYSGGSSGNWGEIRWGTTFNSVTITSVLPPPPVPTLSASPRVKPVGQTIPLTVAIPANVNASATVSLTLTNDNTGILSLPGGNPATTTLTFNAGATNVQTVIVSVVGNGAGNISVLTNATFASAAIRLGTPLNVTEEFSYDAGTENLPGQSGGTGFSDVWGAGYLLAGGSVVSPGLTNGQLVVAGNAAQLFDETDFRPFIAAHGGAGEGTVWISFLVQRQVMDAAWGGVSLFNGGSSGTEALFMGNIGGNYGFIANASPGASQFNGPDSNTNSTMFLVYRIDYSPTNGGNATVSFYANPVVGSTPPLTPTDTATVGNFQFDTLRLGTGSTMNFDEIRMGADWTNVVPFVGLPPPPAPALSPLVKYAPVGQDDVVQLTIPPSVNASSTVNITITNSNPSAFSLSSGNPASVTLTFNAGATNVQTFNAQVLAAGAATLTVVSNASINTASATIGSQVSAYELFQYSTGTLLAGDNGGSGFGASWVEGTSTALNIGGLNYPSLLTSSNAAQITVNGNGFRSLPVTYGGVGGGTVWASVLIQGTDPAAFSNPTYGGFSLFNGGSEMFFMGLSTYVGNNGEYGFTDWAGGGDFYNFTNSVAPGTNVALLVYRLDFPPTNGGQLAITFYANPVLGVTPPAVPTGTATASSFTFNTIRIGTGNTMNFDEVRLGANWGDVVAAPYLGIQKSGSNVQVSWPAAVSTVGNLGLSSSTNLLGTWALTGLSVTNQNGLEASTDTANASAKFYRLQ